MTVQFQAIYFNKFFGCSFSPSNTGGHMQQLDILHKHTNYWTNKWQNDINKQASKDDPYPQDAL